MRRLAFIATVTALAGGACSPSEVRKVPVAGSPQLGASDAWVTLVEFDDFECPYCARAAPTVRQLEAIYSPSDLRVVFKHLPLAMHERALPAALAAQCAGEQGNFWGMYDAMYGNRKLSDEGLAADAQALGLDVAAWSACLSSSAAMEAIDRDVALAKELGVASTPTFFINGYELDGALPLADFQALIDRELKKAQESGIDRARYYDQVVLGQ